MPASPGQVSIPSQASFDIDVDARVLPGGFCLYEALYVWRSRDALPWSQYQIDAADRSLTAAVTTFGFPDRAAVDRFEYPHGYFGSLPSPRGYPGVSR